MKTWRIIKESDGTYEVSSYGYVRRYNGPLLKLIRTTRGYEQVNLPNGFGGNIKSFAVHRLVASAFIPNPEHKKDINHLDNDPTNNTISNLEWCTPQENRAHCVRQGRQKGQPRFEDNTNSKLTIEKVKKIRAMYKAGWRQARIAIKFGIDQSNVSYIVRNKTWKL